MSLIDELDAAALHADWDAQVDAVLADATLRRPAGTWAP